MLQSFVIYGTLILLMFILNLRNAYINDFTETKTISIWSPGIIISLLLFGIISGLRYNVGVDYPTYWHMYTAMKAHPYNDTYQGLELGFYWLLKALAYLYAPVTWMFGILAFIQVFFIYFALSAL